MATGFGPTRALTEGEGGYQSILGAPFMDMDIDRLWTTMNWSLMHLRGWENIRSICRTTIFTLDAGIGS